MAGWPSGGGPLSALITGAGHGIGAVTAQRLAGSGWRVALVDLDLAAAEGIAGRCGPGAVACAADITDQASVESAVAEAVERLGGIDLCFANAGIATTGTLRHTEPEVFAVQVDVNLTGTFRTIHACLPHLLESRGYLLINASGSSIAAPPGLGAYGASKGGVENLGDTLRRELKHHGVDVGVVYLLWVATDLVEGAEAHGDTFGTVRTSLTGPMSKSIPVERAVDAIERGIERRARRVTAPRFVGAFYRLRGLAPAVLERDMVRMAPAVEEATVRDLAGKGLEGAVRSDTAASAAATAEIKERR
jgi:NAD(P)-dependent dehydrogenase (short-subunit alcohol dehydrogenase family)